MGREPAYDSGMQGPVFTLAAATTMVSPWIVLPLAGLTMLLIACHIMSVQVSAMHRARKRLRIANGLLMMFVTAALAYALGSVALVTDAKQYPTQARAFVIVWLVIVTLLTVVVALAVIDALGTAGWGWSTHRALRREFRASLAAKKTTDRGDTTRG